MCEKCSPTPNHPCEYLILPNNTTIVGSVPRNAASPMRAGDTVEHHGVEYVVTRVQGELSYSQRICTVEKAGAITEAVAVAMLAGNTAAAAARPNTQQEQTMQSAAISPSFFDAIDNFRSPEENRLDDVRLEDGTVVGDYLRDQPGQCTVGGQILVGAARFDVKKIEPIPASPRRKITVEQSAQQPTGDELLALVTDLPRSIDAQENVRRSQIALAALFG